MSRSQYDSLVLPAPARGPLRDLLAAAGPALQKRASVQPSSLGLARGDRVKDDHPVRAICAEIAMLIGMPEFEVWISKAHPDMITGEMFAKPSLVIGERVAQSIITPAERFRIARTLFLIAENAMVLRDLSIREISQLFAALGFAAQPNCPLPINVREPDRVPDDAKTLAKLLPRRDRKVLGTLLPQLVPQLEKINVADFARALGLGANRFGLVAAADAKLALEEATQMVADPHGSEMADFLQYMVSEQYFTLRSELGIAPGAQ
jgi:hypothetical protein